MLWRSCPLGQEKEQQPVAGGIDVQGADGREPVAPAAQQGQQLPVRGRGGRQRLPGQEDHGAAHRRGKGQGITSLGRMSRPLYRTGREEANAMLSIGTWEKSWQGP